MAKLSPNVPATAVRKLRHQRQAISECEREFAETSQELKAINRNLLSLPEESRERVTSLAEKMADSLLTKRDIAVNLMPERIAGEDFYQHPLNVAVLSLMLARELNASREAITQLGVGALLHDIGKLNVPDRLQRQPALVARQRAPVVRILNPHQTLVRVADR